MTAESLHEKQAWHVLGAGAIGGLWACRLAAAGHTVTLLTHNSHATERTLKIIDGPHTQSHTFSQQSTATASSITRLLVTTKSHLTASAIAPLLPYLQAATPVVLLQNGMGADDWLNRTRPDLALFPAITTDGVFRQDHDTLVLAGHGATHIGCRYHNDRAKAQNIASVFSAAHGTAAYAEDIQLRRWQKLAMNCAINPLTARYRCRNGELLAQPEAMATTRLLCEETAAVMQAAGMASSADELFQLVSHAARMTAANRSSMLTDVEAGRETEILLLNGYLVERAAHHGIAVPTHAALLKEILSLMP